MAPSRMVSISIASFVENLTGTKNSSTEVSTTFVAIAEDWFH